MGETIVAWISLSDIELPDFKAVVYGFWHSTKKQIKICCLPKNYRLNRELGPQNEGEARWHALLDQAETLEEAEDMLWAFLQIIFSQEKAKGSFGSKRLIKRVPFKTNICFLADK